MPTSSAQNARKPAVIYPLKSTEIALQNFLLAHYERAIRAPQVRSRPFVLLLDPASVCQLQCPVCPTGLENAGRVGQGLTRYRKRTLMSMALFDQVLEELGDYLFYVHLYNWGEPLLNKQLTQFIRKLVDRDIVVDTSTNLSFPMTDRALMELIESGIHRIEASIDGFSQETYSRYRVKGRFELARDNLLRLAALRDQFGYTTQIAWTFLVFRFNEHEIEPTRRFCEEHGIEFVPREAALFETMREEFLPSHRTGESLEGFFEQRQRPFDPETIARRPDLSCAWHYFYSIVNADGSVSPCCVPWESWWDFGMVEPGKTSFASIWNGADLRASRQDVAGKQLLGQLQHSGEAAGLQRVDDFVRKGTICQGCQMQPAILDLYSNRADRIVHQYATHLAGTYPLLDRGFELVRAAHQEQAFVQWYVQYQEALLHPKTSMVTRWKQAIGQLGQKLFS